MAIYKRSVENGITTLKRAGDWFSTDIERTLEPDSTDWVAWIADYITEQKLDHIAWEGTPEDRGASAKEMYEELVKDGCPDEVAKDLTLLVCYELVVLVGSLPTPTSSQPGYSCFLQCLRANALRRLHDDAAQGPRRAHRDAHQRPFRHLQRVQTRSRQRRDKCSIPEQRGGEKERHSRQCREASDRNRVEGGDADWNRAETEDFG